MIEYKAFSSSKDQEERRFQDLITEAQDVIRKPFWERSQTQKFNPAIESFFMTKFKRRAEAAEIKFRKD